MLTRSPAMGEAAAVRAGNKPKAFAQPGLPVPERQRVFPCLASHATPLPGQPGDVRGGQLLCPQPPRLIQGLFCQSRLLGLCLVRAGTAGLLLALVCLTRAWHQLWHRSPERAPPARLTLVNLHAPLGPTSVDESRDGC